jgi:hypothetical protein
MAISGSIEASDRGQLMSEFYSAAVNWRSIETAVQPTE